METQEVYEIQQHTKVVNFEEYAMTIDKVVNQVHLIQEIMEKIMKAGEHYGDAFEGATKPSLLKPGAEKISTTFRLAPKYTITKTDLQNGHREYELICSLYHIPTGQFVGQGMGSCTTMESKYRYRNAAKKCPACGKESIIKGKAEYGGGWLCWQKKGGCGEKWKDGDPAIEKQPDGKVEYDNPADYYNTVLKMGKKRAHVDAVLTATAASDIFTQDIEDLPPEMINKTSAPKNEEEPKKKGSTREKPLNAAQGKAILEIGSNKHNFTMEETKKIIDWYCEKNGRTHGSGEYLKINFKSVLSDYLKATMTKNLGPSIPKNGETMMSQEKQELCLIIEMIEAETGADAVLVNMARVNARLQKPMPETLEEAKRFKEEIIKLKTQKP